MKPYSRLIRHQGNSALFRAIEASVLSTLAGVPLHLHVEGLRGTGKTTILRSARGLFPRITRIKGCLCNCDPDRPHCPAHAGLSAAELTELGVEEVPLPFLEISHSAKTGTVVGTIDLARISDPSNPVAALLPGTIAQAHRGVIFVDEINRLADTSPELADILLDVMGTKPGRIQIEESGLPTVEMPVSVSVWAASNPDEDPGPLETIRRQLSDRFDFVVTVSRPSEVDTVRRILAQAETVAQSEAVAGAAVDGAAVASANATGGSVATGVPPEPTSDSGNMMDEDRFRAIARVRLSRPMQDFLARIYVDFGLESLRAVEAVFHGSRACAALDRRERVSYDDIAFVVPLAFQHRVECSTLARITDHINERIRSRADRRNREAEERAGSDEEVGEAAEGAENAGVAAAVGAAGAAGAGAATSTTTATAATADVTAASTAVAAANAAVQSEAGEASGTAAGLKAAPAGPGTQPPLETGRLPPTASQGVGPSASTAGHPTAAPTAVGRLFDWSYLFHKFRQWVIGRPQGADGTSAGGSVRSSIPWLASEPPRTKDPNRLPTLPPIPGTAPSRNLAGKPANPGLGRNLDEPVPGPGTGGGAGAGPGPGGIANPLEFRVEVPPHMARPLVTLSPESLVRTEEELFHR